MKIRMVGIDVSKNTLDAAFIENEEVRHAVFANEEQGHQALLRWAKGRGIKLVFCMEATGAYSTDLAEYLYEEGYTVYVENARLIKNFRESKGLRNTTDKNSALVIAKYAQANLSDMKSWQPSAPEIKTLREMTRLREALIESRIQWTNRLKSRSLNICADQVKQVIRDIRLHIREVEKAIRSYVKKTAVLADRVDLLCSIDGIGFATAVVLLAELPHLEMFENKGDVVAFAGLNPALRTSGISINFKPMLSKKGSSRIRKALYMPAVVALKRNARIKTFAADLARRKKHSMSIVGAVMRKLICFAFGVLKSGEKYRKDGEKISPRTQLAIAR